MRDKIVNLLKDKKIDSIYIFGSMITGNFRKESDIDIAIVGKLDPLEFFDIKMLLETELPRNIDLIDFFNVDTSFQAEIITSGELIYTKDENKSSQLEMKVLSMYLTLEEDRKVVMDEIKNRGSVFLWKE